MGGDCLNTGCVPSKAIIRSARIARYARRAQEFGLAPMDVQVRFRDVMQRVHRVIETIEPHDSVERFTSLGVDCVQGQAKILSPWEVEVDGERITTPNIVIASGARPRIPDIPGLEKVDYLTSDTVWELQELPRRLLVLGAGPIGCELAQAFAALGSEVTLVTHAERIMPREDPEVSASVEEVLKAEGLQVITGGEPQSFSTDGERSCTLLIGGEQRRLPFDALLLAVGRTANVEGLDLDVSEAGAGGGAVGGGKDAVQSYVES